MVSSWISFNLHGHLNHDCNSHFFPWMQSCPKLCKDWIDHLKSNDWLALLLTFDQVFVTSVCIVLITTVCGSTTASVPSMRSISSSTSSHWLWWLQPLQASPQRFSSKWCCCQTWCMAVTLMTKDRSTLLRFPFSSSTFSWLFLGLSSCLVLLFFSHLYWVHTAVSTYTWP